MGATTRLYGREHERELLRGYFDDLRAGAGGLVLIGGEAGIGKTALVEDLARDIDERDVRLLQGACFDLETSPPFSVWRAIAAALPGTPAPAELESTLVAASTEQPLLVVLEDIQWADPTSLELLRSIGRIAGSLPLLLVATYQDDYIAIEHPLFQYLPFLVREARAERIHLRPLETST